MTKQQRRQRRREVRAKAQPPQPFTEYVPTFNLRREPAKPLPKGVK